MVFPNTSGMPSEREGGKAYQGHEGVRIASAYVTGQKFLDQKAQEIRRGSTNLEVKDKAESEWDVTKKDHKKAVEEDNAGTISNMIEQLENDNKADDMALSPTA